ncbi:DUF799 domain-containing protein [Achromobacter xylosoxidans]|uniref:DUF799 domain-containing protein n=1 Tax=Alcaligenes xylosoxydans xylosoxydans TaxID=85698 RepID=UPI00211AB21B|nr:DUF799 domain-containing protein [Achromobacter xylosoxidans]
MMLRLIKAALAVCAAAALAGCAAPRTVEKNDYSKFRAENPRSVLVVPVVNRSVEVDAPDSLLTTITRPLAERGYYVFPVNLVKQVMNEEGMSDADMVHANDPVRLAGLFGADSVLYISIERWDARYAVIGTTVTVALTYTLKSGKTGETIWETQQSAAYASRTDQGLIGALISAAIEKAAPSYMPLARQANTTAVYVQGRGLPAGPYDPVYLKDQKSF